jgi:hypothetical protein
MHLLSIRRPRAFALGVIGPATLHGKCHLPSLSAFAAGWQALSHHVSCPHCSVTQIHLIGIFVAPPSGHCSHVAAVWLPSLLSNFRTVVANVYGC